MVLAISCRNHLRKRVAFGPFQAIRLRRWF